MAATVTPSYTYDARGQVTGQTDSVSGVGSGYSFSMAYNDAGQPTSLTYSDGEVLGTGYNAYGWLNQAQTTPAAAAPSPWPPLSATRATRAPPCNPPPPASPMARTPTAHRSTPICGW